MTEKIHILNKDKLYKIANKINAEDYVMLHKAELKLLSIKEAENRFAYKFFEVVSTIIIGCEIDKLLSDTFNTPIDSLILFGGISFAVYSIVCFIKRNNEIDKIINEKLNNS